jgi:hypothetical protein
MVRNGRPHRFRGNTLDRQVHGDPRRSFIMSTRHNFVTAIYHATAAPVCRKIVGALLRGQGAGGIGLIALGLSSCRGSRGQPL